MRKLISILVALGVVLSFSVMATPVAAVEEGTVAVQLSYPVAKNLSDYCIQFHNIGTLEGGDYIDIMFPSGTNVTGFLYYGMQKRADKPSAPPASCGPPIVAHANCNWTTGVSLKPVGADLTQIGNTTIRLELASGYNITKCDYVKISLGNITNPTSCEHHLEVGTSAHTPVDSNPYTIYCAKIKLEGGVFPATGADMMNLISVPCYPSDTAIETVLEALFCEVSLTASSPDPFSFSVWYWDNDADAWSKYVSDSSFTDLKTIEAGKAYWVKPSYDMDIYVHGDPYPLGQGPPIKWCYPRCWNMVGFASLAAMNASQYLAYTVLPPGWTPAVYAVWGWNTMAQGYYDVGFSPPFWSCDDGPLTPGEGYWMAFIDEACIIPPAQTDC